MALEHLIAQQQQLSETLVELEESFAAEQGGRMRTLREVVAKIREQRGFSTP